MTDDELDLAINHAVSDPNGSAVVGLLILHARLLNEVLNALMVETPEDVRRHVVDRRERMLDRIGRPT